MNQKLTYVVKTAGKTGLEVAIVGGSMIATKHLLDFNKIFKKKIADDPKFAESFVIKHQGAIRLGAGLIGAAYFKNPYLKLMFLGIAVEGFITEARQLTKDASGNSAIEQIGGAPSDQDLLEVAAQYDNNMGGYNPTDEGRISVAGHNPTNDGRISVAGSYDGPIDLNSQIPYSVGAQPWGTYSQVWAR